MKENECEIENGEMKEVKKVRFRRLNKLRLVVVVV